VIATLFFLVDQIIKFLIRGRLANGESLLGSGSFQIAHFENFYGPFSLPFPMWSVTALHVLVLSVALAYYFFQKKYRHGLIWIIGGGTSNLIDRLYFGSTTDYISFPWNGFWNLADFMVVIGIALILFTKENSPQPTLEKN